MLKISTNILLGLLAFIASILLSAHFTGRTKRAYKTLLPSDTMTVAGKTVTVENLALQYKPEMYLRPTTPTPPLKWVWYEATPADSTLDITYYFAWENEIDPNRALNGFYSVFRAAYYGYPLYDIEYFQISVNKLTGDVKRIRFETSDSDNYYPVTVNHIIDVIDKGANGNYYCNKKVTDVEFDSLHVKAGVQTWNHLSRLLDKSAISQYSILLNSPLKFLSDADYMQYKFARKSHGDHQTTENKIAFYLSSLLIFTSAIIPVYFIRRKRR